MFFELQFPGKLTPLLSNAPGLRLLPLQLLKPIPCFPQFALRNLNLLSTNQDAVASRRRTAAERARRIVDVAFESYGSCPADRRVEGDSFCSFSILTDQCLAEHVVHRICNFVRISYELESEVDLSGRELLGGSKFLWSDKDEQKSDVRQEEGQYLSSHLCRVDLVQRNERHSLLQLTF